MAAKKTSTKKVATEVVEVKETVKKETVKKPAKKQEVIIQFAGREVLEKDIVANVKKAWTDMGNKVSDMADVKIYVKPEEATVYYVINDEVSGSIEM